MAHTLRILHLSDLHERGPREKERWRRYRVLGGDAWQHALDDFVGEAPIDLVCFTGDLANFGMADEYEPATHFLRSVLERVHVAPEHLFLVPGNHDIHRDCEGAKWDELRQGILEIDDLVLARWIAGGPSPRGFDDGVRQRIMRRGDEYRAWLTDTLQRPDLLPAATLHPFLGYRRTLRLSKLPFDVHLIGLDSAWLAGSDNDSGKLLLTDEQVMRLASNDGRQLSGFRLGLIHHPLTDLHDEHRCRPLLAEHIDLLLRGHLHRERIETTIDPAGTSRQLAAGSLYEGDRADRWPNGCHLITVVLDDNGRPQHYEVRFKTWSPAGHWFDDGGVYRDAKFGRLTIPVVPSSVPTPLPPTPAPSPPDRGGLVLRTHPDGHAVFRFDLRVGEAREPEPVVDLYIVNTSTTRSFDDVSVVLDIPSGVVVETSAHGRKGAKEVLHGNGRVVLPTLNPGDHALVGRCRRPRVAPRLEDCEWTAASWLGRTDYRLRWRITARNASPSDGEISVAVLEPRDASIAVDDVKDVCGAFALSAKELADLAQMSPERVTKGPWSDRAERVVRHLKRIAALLAGLGVEDLRGWLDVRRNVFEGRSATELLREDHGERVIQWLETLEAGVPT